jgi:hypothetical protein
MKKHKKDEKLATQTRQEQRHQRFRIGGTWKMEKIWLKKEEQAQGNTYGLAPRRPNFSLKYLPIAQKLV